MNMTFENIEDIRSYLDNIPKFQDVGSKAAHMGLDQMERFCEALGNPQNDLRAVHVAGTNGKGTVCHILSSIYKQAGFKVGLYTSPHLIDFKERIKINGQEIPDENLIHFFKKYSSLIDRYPVTYFELMTALAFWWFHEQKVDIAIIETGLGGRLDATNIITPLVSVITSVALDHKAYLGETIKEIAIEKAGIIKHGVPVVIGRLPDAAREVMLDKAGEMNAPVYHYNDLHPNYKDGIIELKDTKTLLRLETDLIGSIQAVNLSIGWQVIKCLHYRYMLTTEQFIEAVKHIRKTSGLRARFEPLIDGKDWYFDGAHNIEAIKVLKESVKTIAKKREPVIILSLMKDKIDEKFLYEFSEFKKIFYYEINSERAATYEEVKNHIQQLQLLLNEWGNIYSILKRYKSKLVIFTGSFYFYSTVRDWIKKYNLN
jgi:dihydrofolate synthase/folylpolyglutamate synthase